MAAPESSSGGCPRLTLLRRQPGVAYEYGLSTCTKYNTNPPRGIPEQGEEVCAAPGSNPVNCWLDMRSCRKAEMARRAYNRSFLGQVDPQGEPRVARVETDAYGREFYCLQRNGAWVHEGEHEFPVPPARS